MEKSGSFGPNLAGFNTDFLLFWDKTDKVDTLVISSHGFVKKVDKVASSDIDKAERIRLIYFEQKKKGK
jgi:hypothetical protein